MQFTAIPVLQRGPLTCTADMQCTGWAVMTVTLAHCKFALCADCADAFDFELDKTLEYLAETH